MEFMSSEFLKPSVAGGLIYLMETQYYKADNTSAMKFGGAVAIGVFAGSSIDNMLGLTSSKTLSTGKGLENRLIEIGSGAGAAYMLNKYVLKNDYTQNEMLMKVGEIVIADVLSEYVIAAVMST